jgi:uncharacterized protein
LKLRRIFLSATIFFVFLIMAALGVMFINNEIDKGVSSLKSEKYALSKQYFEPMARVGNSNAQYYMGVIYARGWGMPRNRKIAVEWFKRACAAPFALRASDCVDLHFYIGEAMITNPTDAADYSEGVAWLKDAAKAGSYKAAEKIEQLKSKPPISRP